MAVATRDLDEQGLVRMGEAECWTFLAAHRLGRVAIVQYDRPLVYPVNYVLDAKTVVFRSAPGTKLSAAVRHDEVAFEVDVADELFESGASVLVHGRLEEVTDPAERRRLLALPLRMWAPGTRDHVLRIEPRWVTGRSFAGIPPADGLGVDAG